MGDDVNYAEILAELETVGRRISQAKRELVERKKGREGIADTNFDP